MLGRSANTYDSVLVVRQRPTGEVYEEVEWCQQSYNNPFLIVTEDLRGLVFVWESACVLLHYNAGICIVD